MENTAIQQDTIFMAAASDVGKVRKINEDSFYFSRKNNFFLLCDGMGGHESGEVASKLAVETLQHVIRQPDFFNIEQISKDLPQKLPKTAIKLVSGIRIANRRILHQAIGNPGMRGMGTTIAAAIYEQGKIYIAHVGDSRVYRLRNGNLEQLTVDHSWLNELLEDNEITENQIKEFNEKNVLTRALGTYPTVKIDIKIENVKSGDLYLLCSDGLHNGLHNEIIKDILNSSKHTSLQSAVDEIVAEANKRDGTDNITAGLIYMPALETESRPTSYVKTMSDETDAVSQAIDKMIKNIYSLPSQKSMGLRKWLAIAAGVLAVIAIMFLSAYRAQMPDTANAAVTSALFSTRFEDDIRHPAHIKPENFKEAGSLVLIQIQDPRYLEVIQSLKDVKVLDVVSAFNKRIPVHEGNFTWAIADSTDRILYQKNALNISAQPKENKNLRSMESQQNTSSINASNSDQERALIYVVGAFEGDAYQDSYIYANNHRIGNLKELVIDGFYLTPGRYSLSIRSQSGRIQHRKDSVVIEKGQMVAIEF